MTVAEFCEFRSLLAQVDMTLVSTTVIGRYGKQ